MRATHCIFSILPADLVVSLGDTTCLSSGQARAALSIEADAFWIDQQWGEPMSGHGSECAWSPEPGTLYVDSTIKMQGKTAQYRQVYRRQ